MNHKLLIGALAIIALGIGAYVIFQTDTNNTANVQSSQSNSMINQTILDEVISTQESEIHTTLESDTVTYKEQGHTSVVTWIQNFLKNLF